MSRTDYRSRPSSRPGSVSDQLSDLHVYVVPVDIWRERFNNLLNQSVTETVSLGIIRVPPDMRLVDVREEIVQQLEGVAPQDYVFLRSCGRSLTRLKSKQEYQLKVKHCLPPVAYAPELFLLESSALNYGSDTDSRSQSSMRQLHVSDRDTPHGHRGYGSFRDGYRSPGNKSFREKDGYSGRDNHDRYGQPELSPDDHYRTGNRDNYNEENERRRRDLQNRLNRDRVDADQQDDDLLDDYRFEDIADRDQIDRERFEHDDEYRHQWVEEEKRKREEERRRKDDGRYDHDGDPDRDRTSDQDRSPDRNRDKSQDRGRNRYDDRKKMERTASDDELARYPSPPELRMQSPLQTERLTTSARQRKKDEKEKLLKDLEAARESRKNTEREREELVKKAKQLQSKTQNRRNHARDVWKKRYFEEKKKTPPLEEQMNRMRQELDAVHRKLMITLEGPKEKNVRFGDVKPSLKNNYVIQCTRLQHEIEDLRRRVENAKMKLTAEMKLRNQAEAELRALRAELTQKKITLTLARNQQFAALSPVIEPIPQAPMTSRG